VCSLKNGALFRIRSSEIWQNGGRNINSAQHTWGGHTFIPSTPPTPRSTHRGRGWPIGGQHFIITWSAFVYIRS
jgi:hypothetical protein